MKRIFIAMALALVCLQAGAVTFGKTAYAQGAPATSATLVGVDPVRFEPLTQTVPVIGRLVARRSGLVACRFAGPVEEIDFKVGDHVSAGEVIAKINVDSRRAEMNVYNARIAETRADLASSRAQVTLAEQELKRQTDLKKSGAFSRSRFDTAQQELLRARARVLKNTATIKTHEASRLVMEIDIERASIKAPFDGVVVEKMTEAGSYLRLGDPVMRIVSPDSLEIEAAVPSRRLGGLQPGTPILGKFEDGVEVHATVRSALPVENPTTRTRPVRFTAQWPHGVEGLADGQSITVFLPLGATRKIVTVHKDAIVRKRGADVVFIVTEGKATPQKVKLGEATGSRVEVVTGLKAGDVAVVRGNERLQPGAAVRIKKGS